jgi:hypothetical protein
MSEEREVCQLARYPPEFFVEALTPHTKAYENVQSVLFWRRPVHFCVLLAIVEFGFMYVSHLRLGVLSLTCLAVAAFYVLHSVYVHIGDRLADTIFRPLNEDAPGQSSRICPLLPFCRRLSHIVSTVAGKLAGVCQSNDHGSTASLLISATVSAGFFVIFQVVGTFWFLFGLVHIFLLLPGVVMHPKMFQYTQPIIHKFEKAIKCPYCHAKAE